MLKVTNQSNCSFESNRKSWSANCIPCKGVISQNVCPGYNSASEGEAPVLKI